MSIMGQLIMRGYSTRRGFLTLLLSERRHPQVLRGVPEMK